VWPGPKAKLVKLSNLSKLSRNHFLTYLINHNVCNKTNLACLVHKIHFFLVKYLNVVLEKECGAGEGWRRSVGPIM
jgi:hypothetical protein